MMKLLVPRLKPQFDISDWISVLNVLEKKSIENYETEFSNKFGCQYGTMFSHGRSGIYALLKVWGILDSEVICPAYTCVVVPDAIVLSGNTPVFVDCGTDSFNMSLAGIESAITKDTRVIIATHLFGYPMDVKEIQKIANEATKRFEHKVYVIQDCAHSYGAEWEGDLVSSWGDAAIFGSNISKIINSIFGGMVITNNRETCLGLKKWRQDNCKYQSFSKTIKRFFYFIAVNFAFLSVVYSFVNFLERKGFLDHFVKYYEDGVVKFPLDWDQFPVAIEARVGRSQLRKYDEISSKRLIHAKQIEEYFEGNADIAFRAEATGASYSHLVGLVHDRDLWVKTYRDKGIQLGILIEYSIPGMSAYEKYKTTDVPHSDYYSEHCVNFPLHRRLKL